MINYVFENEAVGDVKCKKMRYDHQTEGLEKSVLMKKDWKVKPGASDEAVPRGGRIEMF